MEGDHIQKDWEERDWIEEVHVNTLRLASFVNHFGPSPLPLLIVFLALLSLIFNTEASTRDRLSKLNDSLLRMEREVDFLEARFVTIQQATAKT